MLSAFVSLIVGMGAIQVLYKSAIQLSRTLAIGQFMSKQLNVRLPDGLLELIRDTAEVEGLSQGKLLGRAMTAYLGGDISSATPDEGLKAELRAELRADINTAVNVAIQAVVKGFDPWQSNVEKQIDRLSSVTEKLVATEKQHRSKPPGKGFQR